MSTRAKNWSLAAAKETLPEVRTRTGRAFADVERLEAARDSAPAGTDQREEIEAKIAETVQRWVREMEALGLEVKGIWLVDFDSGAGYYCWTWPEEELAFFHGYEEGFGRRARIQ